MKIKCLRTHSDILLEPKVQVVCCHIVVSVFIKMLMLIDNKTQHDLSFTILNTIRPTYKSYLEIDLMHIMQKSWIHVENLVSLSRSTNT